MALVQGKNLTLYTGDQMNVIGCEESCTLTITNEEIITTSKGSGRFTNREYGGADWTVQSNGVIFMYASESAAGSGGKTDPLYLTAYALEGKKVCVKIQFSDGTTTKYLIGNGIITNVVNTGSAEGYATFDVTIAADGKLYQSDNLQSSPNYDGPSVYIYTASGTVDGFSSVTIEDSSRLYFIVLTTAAGQKVYQTSDIQTLANAIDLPTGTGTVGYHAPTGTINFQAGLVSGNSVLVSFDVAD